MKAKHFPGLFPSVLTTIIVKYNKYVWLNNIYNKHIWLNIINIIVLGALLYSQIVDKETGAQKDWITGPRFHSLKEAVLGQVNLTQFQIIHDFNGKLRDVNFPPSDSLHLLAGRRILF